MRAYWSGKNTRNWGDLVTPFLIEKITGQKPELDLDGKGRLLGVGSIAERVNHNDVIWGSGLIKRGRIPHVEGVIINAIRGPLTKKYLELSGYKVPDVFGDPALLVSEFFVAPQKKKYHIGIIPHFEERKLPIFKGLRTIDIASGFYEVINAVNECEIIISSSLHGVVVAEAYGIPTVAIRVSNKLIGNDFKFEDYYAGTGRILYRPRVDDLTDNRIKFLSWLAVSIPKPVFDKQKLLDSFPNDL